MGPGTRGSDPAVGEDADLGTRRHPPDFRLAPSALAVWAVVLLGVVLGSAVAIGLTAAAAVLAAVSLRPGTPMALRAVTGCALAAGMVITAHTMLVDRHPLRAAAERGAAATVRLRLDDDPHPIRAQAFGARPGGATQVLIAGSLRQAQIGGDRWSTGGRVLLIAPAEGWDRLLPGQTTNAEGLLAPAGRRDLTVAVLRVRGPPRDPSEPPWWQTAAGGLRDGLREAAGVLSPASAGLLPGLAVGDTSRLTAEVDADFRVAGLTHLLAVSGANLAIVSGAVLGLLRAARADPRLAAGLSLAVMLGFVVLARPSPSVVRAAVMGAVVLLALAAGRGRSAVPALAAAVLVLVLADPALAVNPGFGLSVSATAALVLLAPGWAEGLQRRGVPGWVAEALAVPTAAFVVTAPLVAGLSGQLSLVTVLANLLAVPAVAPATVLGVLAAVLSPLGQPVAQLCAWAAAPAVGWLVLVGDRSAAVPGAAVPWPDGLPGGLLLAAVVVLVLVLGRSPRFRALLAAVLLGVALVLVPTRVVPPGWPPTGWSVIACDVGQGDAIVLATAQPGWVVLVDTGPEDGPVDGCLDRLGVRGIALVVLSHLHADHIGGLGGALRGRAVAGIAVGPVTEPRWSLREVARQAEAEHVPLVQVRAGERLRWPGLVVDVIGPRHPATVLDPDDGTAVNDGSVVLRAATPGGSVLLSGDIELSAHLDLVDAGVPLRADVLKMPHHGSRYSAPRFLAAVSPRAVLVSVGAGNRYRHPDGALLDRLAAAGAVTRRTDQAGDVAVVAGPGGPPGTDLTVVSRGDPRPAPSRSGRTARVPVRTRAPPGPRPRPWRWTGRLRSDRSARPPRRASSARHR